MIFTTKPRFKGPDRRSPQSLITSFCHDYKLWNDYCHKHSIRFNEPKFSAQRKARQMKAFSRIYRAFIEPYAAEETVRKKISFGTDATFDPSRLKFGPEKQETWGTTLHFSIQYTYSTDCDDHYAEVISEKDKGLCIRQIYYIDAFPDDLPEGQSPYWPSL